MNGEKITSPSVARREHLVQQMVDALGEEHSRVYYRRLADRYRPAAIFEAGAVYEASGEGRVRKGKGALFVATLNHTGAATR